jgi:myosin X
MPVEFDQAAVLNHLWYSRMLSEDPQSRVCDLKTKDFYKRYKMLMREVAWPEDTEEMQLYDSSNSEWQLGKTKVFFPKSLEQKLEKLWEEEVHQAVMGDPGPHLGQPSIKEI